MLHPRRDPFQVGAPLEVELGIVDHRRLRDGEHVGDADDDTVLRLSEIYLPMAFSSCQVSGQRVDNKATAGSQYPFAQHRKQ